jgi:hypothetical protein
MERLGKYVALFNFTDKSIGVFATFSAAPDWSHSFYVFEALNLLSARHGAIEITYADFI